MSRQHGRKGSLQYWPRKRARRIYPRVNWDGIASKIEEATPLGFPVFKAGMTHVKYIDMRPNSSTYNKPIIKTVTILEAPSFFVAAVRFYKKSTIGLTKGVRVAGETWAEAIPKELDLDRKTTPSKKKSDFKPEDLIDVQILAVTQPKKSGMKKKKPDVLEIGLGGSVEDKMKFAESILGKEVSIKDVFKAGEWIDVTAVTRGFGMQGPVQRIGVRIQGRKDKQRQRKAGSMGPVTPRKMDWRVAQSGQYGFFNRTEFNKKLLTIGDDPNQVNAKGGLLRYGLVKGTHLLVEGSVPGPTKRLIVVRKAFRPKAKEIPVTISYISTVSKQGLR